MGYPMTYSRFVRCNGLSEGGYENQSTGSVNVGDNTHGAHLAMMRGDLRRLEADALDGRTVSEWISVATGVDQDLVTEVLTVFLSDKI